MGPLVAMMEPDPRQLRDLDRLPNRRPPAHRDGPGAGDDPRRDVACRSGCWSPTSSSCSSATSCSTSRASTGPTSTAASSTASGWSATSCSGCPPLHPTHGQPVRSPADRGRAPRPDPAAPARGGDARRARPAGHRARRRRLVRARRRRVRPRSSRSSCSTRLAGMVGHLARDIERRAVLEAQLSYQAFHDPLTGLANRRRFIEAVGELDRGRHGNRRPVPRPRRLQARQRRHGSRRRRRAADARSGTAWSSAIRPRRPRLPDRGRRVRGPAPGNAGHRRCRDGRPKAARSAQRAGLDRGPAISSSRRASASR